MGIEIKGINVTKSIGEALRPRIMMLKERRIIPTLAIVRVGEREDDIYYQRSAVKRADAVGVAVEAYVFDVTITEEEFINEIHNLNMDDRIHGILILRPLPKHIRDDAVSAALAPAKDVDGITDVSLAGIIKRERQGFAPCTARACIEILLHYGVNPAGKRAVVVGRSLVVGKPVALMLTTLDATVTVCHTRTEDMPSITREADILVVAAGRANMIGKSYVKQDAVVIDVGINVDAAGNLAGDVDFENVLNTAGMLTPVPGGVGTVTTSVLMLHTVEAAERAVKYQ